MNRFNQNGAVCCVDLRALEPPEPLLRILEALDRSSPGPHEFLLRLEPTCLYPLLAGQGWSHAATRDARGCVVMLYREGVKR